MRINVPCKKVIVPKYCIAKLSLKFLLCKMSPCKSVPSCKSDPACKRVAVQKCHLVQKWPSVHKWRRAKESPCKNLSSCKSDLSCKSVLVQKCPLVQKWCSCKSDPFPFSIVYVWSNKKYNLNCLRLYFFW